MSVYAELADGRRLEFPDGTDPSVMQATVKKVLGQSAAPAAPRSVEDNYGPMNGWDAAMVGAGKATTRIGQGLQQAYYGLTGNDAAAAALKARVADENARYDPLEKAHPIATAAGESLPAMAIPIGASASVPAAIAKIAGASAIPGALEYGTLAERAKRAGLDAAGGAIGGGVAAGIGRVAQPLRGAVDDATSSLFAKYGLNPLPSQSTGSKPMAWLESALATLPGGGSIRAAAADQQKALNRAAMGKIGATGDAVTPEAVQAAKGELGNVFDVVPAGVTVDIDKGVARQLMTVEAEHLKNLSPDQRSVVSQYVNDILAHGENGMPGDVYQKARSRIAARANSTQDSELKSALTGIYKTLDNAFDRSAPKEAVDAMKEVRAQWGAAKQITKMANESGNISADRLATAGKTMRLGDLPKLAESVRKLPSSGSAERLAYLGLLSGATGAGADFASGNHADALKWGMGALVAPTLASKLLTSKIGKKYLTDGLLDISPEMEKWLMRGGGLLGNATIGGL